MTTASDSPRPAWFVGAAFGGYDDQHLNDSSRTGSGKVVL